MTRIQKWSAGTAAVVLLIFVAGWLLLVSPKRAEADQLHTTAAAQVAQNQQLATQITQLKAQYAQLPQQRAKLATFHQKVPQTPALPSLVRALATIASQSGVTVATVTPAPPGLPVTAGPTSGGAAAKAAAASPDGSQLQVIAVTIEVDGTYYNVERFLSRLETLPRSVLVTGFTMTSQASAGPATGAPGANVGLPSVGASPQLKVTVNARVFMSAVPPADPTATPAPVPAK